MIGFKRHLSAILLLVISLSLSVGLGLYRPVIGEDHTEILWDTWGVPHIYANNAETLFHAMGWAQTASHGNLILQLYGQARGQAAEYWGETYLKSDQYVRTMGIPTRARAWYAAQSPRMRGYLDQFAAGINAYAQAHGDQIDDGVKVVLPITGVDILAHVQRVIHFNFVVSPQAIASLTSPPSDSLSETLDPMDASGSSATPGSNAWAIAPSHSASGHGMLLANPHLPWSSFFLWYEAQLTAPGIDTYGVALVGMPVLAIAFNDDLGWTFTVNTHDGWDAYALTLAEGGYRFDGQVRPFASETQILKVKQQDGTWRDEPLTIRHSLHGPVVGEKDGKAIALRVVGLDQPEIMTQLWDMAQAHHLQDFETAVKRLQLPMFTILYADQDGHILHLFNGQVPIHAQGNWQDWQGIVPGDTSATLWTNYHPYEDLPRVLDPPSGWLQNANDPPWTTTFPAAIHPDQYPAYIAPQGMDFRAQRSAKMLMAEPKMSFEQMIRDKFSSRMELADRILDELIVSARQLGSPLAQDAADTLATWDRQANAESRGAVLFAVWARSMPETNWFATPWSADEPLTTPHGFADPEGAVKILEVAATTVKFLYGSLDVPWGEVARLHYHQVDLPATGGPGFLGSFRVIDLLPQQTGTRFHSVAGDSYIAAIEFSHPIKAKTLTVYGNATQPNSPHIGDQLPLYTQNQLRPVWRTRAEIEANLESRTTF